MSQATAIVTLNNYPFGNDNTQRRQRVFGTVAISNASYSSTVAISNGVETSQNIVTLTVGSNIYSAGENVDIAGLSTFTWLNGHTVQLTASFAIGTTHFVTFVDPTAHGAQASTSDSGTLYIPGLTVTFANQEQIKTTDLVPVWGVVQSFNGYLTQYDFIHGTVRIFAATAGAPAVAELASGVSIPSAVYNDANIEGMFEFNVNI